MAKTFDKIVYSLLEIVTNFKVTDDVEYPVLWIEDAVISVHNTLMREAHNNNTLGPELLLLHENIPVNELTGEVEIQGIPIPIKSKLCYSDIPELVSGIALRFIDYLGTVDLSTPFSYRKISVLINDDGTLYKLPEPVYSILGNRLLFSRKDMAGKKVVSLIGYFRDPRVINTYNPGEPFPTPSEYKLELVALRHLLSAKGVLPDVINDAQRALNQPTEQSEENRPTSD